MLRLPWLMILLLLAGCATDRPLSFGCTRLKEFRTPVDPTPEVTDAAMGLAPPSPLSSLVAGTISSKGPEADLSGNGNNFLVLSGGGPWGAFGAGLLEGWSKQGTGDFKRPTSFNLVTGVSTGALQATYAFLGEKEDQALIDSYTIESERQLVLRHGSAFFLSHASMADTAPLASYVREHVGPLLDEVAAKSSGRKLLVGAVDALDGKMYAIDLTRIATELSGTERLDCYTGALLASAAVPIVFRQVTIDGKPYMDGGVRQSVFVTTIQHAANEALVNNAAAGRMYVVMNGDVATLGVDDVPPKLLPTLGRLRTLVFNQIELTSIYNVAAKQPSMRSFLVTAAGQDCQKLITDQAAIFDPAFMRCLIAYGKSRWSNGSPWREIGVGHATAQSAH